MALRLLKLEYQASITTASGSTLKTPLSFEQKQENKIISSIRMTVEYAITGIKRLGCMTQSLRNRRPFIDETFILPSTGIWNFHLRMA
ncbi:hypothetical protein SK355_01165 [Candidatus Fukatsuia symbiotica]|uniref:DDE Tnp4 domain-containing protein n=2 Tax=Enterobacterales TaxID=91347 RepID=A0A2U8I7K5_9GAMM|nr:hypothetical protein [Candidatus Fukatsuia symbiotica]AWK15140.1 hypothetical protein CCS41_12755 [Candidatus Fukatsuia symbiotica]MEA9443965.1 hypothetical protein [Candidatus Fukatsuia symbiotica]